MIDLKYVQDWSQANLAVARKIERIVNKSDFEEACTKATQDQMDDMFALVEAGMPDSLIQWVKARLPVKDIHEMNSRELRQIARKYLIKNWFRLNRDEMLEEIEEKRRMGWQEQKKS